MSWFFLEIDEAIQINLNFATKERLLPAVKLGFTSQVT